MFNGASSGYFERRKQRNTAARDCQYGFRSRLG
jgi:hypothetical protein